MLNEITSGAQTVGAAGPVTGTLDTSAIANIESITLEVLGLTAGAAARITIEDTASATAFSDAQPVAVFHLQGTIQPSATLAQTIGRDQLQTLRNGAANNKLRVNVLQLTGAAASLTLNAYAAS
jgi:hypothetical protein